MSTGIALTLRDVALRLGRRPLIGPLNVTIAPGEIVTLMGPSGCGKSSLLAFLCGTLDHAFTARGQAFLGDIEVTALPPEQRRMGILFQDDLLFPHLSVAENLAFGLPAAVRGEERRARILAALAEAELDGFSERDPATLSGGQRARIALMRTLLSEPRALLLDEPFSKLDAGLRGRVRRFVFEHARRDRLPTLLVTHDPADAEAAGGTVYDISVAEAPEAGAAEPAAAREVQGPVALARAGLDKPGGGA